MANVVLFSGLTKSAIHTPQSAITECPMCEPGGGEEPGSCQYCAGTGHVALNKAIGESIPPLGEWQQASRGTEGVHEASHGRYKMRVGYADRKFHVLYAPRTPQGHGTEETVGKFKTPALAHAGAVAHHSKVSGLQKAIALNRATGAMRGQSSAQEHAGLGGRIARAFHKLPFVGTRDKAAAGGYRKEVAGQIAFGRRMTAGHTYQHETLPKTVAAAHSAFHAAGLRGTTTRHENGVYHVIHPGNSMRRTTRSTVDALQRAGHTVLGVQRHPMGGNSVKFHTGAGVLHYARIPRVGEGPKLTTPKIPRSTTAPAQPHVHAATTAAATPKPATGPLSTAEHDEYRDLAFKAASGKLRPQHEKRLEQLASRHASAGGHVALNKVHDVSGEARDKDGKWTNSGSHYDAMAAPLRDATKVIERMCTREQAEEYYSVLYRKYNYVEEISAPTHDGVGLYIWEVGS